MNEFLEYLKSVELGCIFIWYLNILYMYFHV